MKIKVIKCKYTKYTTVSTDPSVINETLQCDFHYRGGKLLLKCFARSKVMNLMIHFYSSGIRTMHSIFVHMQSKNKNNLHKEINQVMWQLQHFQGNHDPVFSLLCNRFPNVAKQTFGFRYKSYCTNTWPTYFRQNLLLTQ